MEIKIEFDEIREYKGAKLVAREIQRIHTHIECDDEIRKLVNNAADAAVNVLKKGKLK